MTKPIILEPRAKPIMAPNWVARSIDGSCLLGKGSYASVYGCKDGSALKITRDMATYRLAKRLSKKPVRGLPRVLRACWLDSAKTPTMAISMQRLSRLPRPLQIKLFAVYKQALIRTCNLHGFKGQGYAKASKFASELAGKVAEATFGFSSCLCIQMAALCLPTPSGENLRRALIELSNFCIFARCDVDLMGMDNWMLDASGALTLSDPVVHKAYAF